MNNGRVRKSPNTLIRAYKKKNRERNIILQCIVVSVVVVSLVIISLIHGKFQADKLKNQYQDGKTISTFIEEGTDTIKRQLQDLSYVNSVGEEKESGRLMNGRYSYSKCVVLDETAYEDMVKPTFVHFYGNYPEQTDEIMMSKKTLDYLGISSPKIGMKITLDFYWNDIFTTKMTGKQEFVLSGYYNSYNNELSDSSIAYISKNRIKQAGISQYPCRLCVDVKDWGLSGRQVENRLKNDINLNDKQRIISYDSAEYRAIEGTVGNYLLAYMFVLAVFFCLFLVIYNVVYISLGSDIKQYGLLRTIGATNRQIKKLVCMQIGDIYLKSCLCGVIISIVLQYCVLNNVVKNLYLGEYKANSQLKLFNLSAYIVVLVLVAITLFGATLLAVYKLTMITPIEAAKYEEVVGEQQSDYQFGKMFIIKRTGIIFGMAFRNILRYKKKFMFIIIFLAFGCEIGLLGIVVTKGTNQMNRLQKNPDFTIEVPMDTVTYLVENGKDEVELITDDNIVDIKNTLTSYTENLKIVQGFLPIIKNAAETDSLKIVEHDSLPVMQTLDDKSMKKLVKYVEENNILVDQKTFNEKGGVLILHENLIPQTYEDIETECIGKIIELYDLVPVGTAMQEMSTVKLRNCGYINISQSDCPTLDLSWRGNDKVYLIVSDKTFSKLKDVLTVRNLEVQINVKANKEAICKQKLKAWVQEANLKFQSTTGNENQLLYVIKCNSDEIAKQSLYIRTSQIIMYTISGILIFMGLLNYFSTTSTNIIIRQREFSIMRSIGMTQGMLRKMLIYEGIIYVGGVLGLLLIIGSIVMGIVVYILKQNIEYFVFQYPFEGLLCIICIMSFLCVIIPNIFLHKMERNSLIERIKKER